MIADMRRLVLCTTLLVALSAGFSASAAEVIQAGQTQYSCSVDPQLTSLIAASDVVLLGRMDVPTQRLDEEAHKPRPDYLDIPVESDGVLKGSADISMVRFLPHVTAYSPSPEAVFALSGAPALLFLTRVDEGPIGLYFAGYSPKALAPATEQSIAAARSEIARQEAIASTWVPNRSLPHYNEVKALISRLGRVSDNAQQHVFDQLISLGTNAVPAIIAQMDDRRALRTTEISLRNLSPDAFEGVRHYGPDQVVDGLDAVLNQITGASFGAIFNGGSDRERDAAVAGWRVYGADLNCRPHA